MKIECPSHGTEEWAGHVICSCGRVHKIVVGMKAFTCPCGRDVTKWAAICSECCEQKAKADA